MQNLHDKFKNITHPPKRRDRTSKLSEPVENAKKDESQDNRLIDESNREIDIIILLRPYVTEGPNSFPAEKQTAGKRTGVFRIRADWFAVVCLACVRAG